VTTHPTAILEAGVEVGEHSSIWDNVHIRRDTRIGEHCSVGGKTHIAYEVVIGDYVKINSSVYICTGVEIEDMCMISAGVVFTNDRFPRAMNRELTDLETSEPTGDTLRTLVRRGTTIGANATIGPGITLGAFSMIGMGAVVSRDVPDQALVVGNPARIQGWVCVCGPRLVEADTPPPEGGALACARCQRSYHWTASGLLGDSPA
jgi:UDP-2-acetamido-3-amino-2,3-dideoxy-glucuronate N-acetyltransferase